MGMTPEVKSKLSKTIRALQGQLPALLGDALEARYRLSVPVAKAALDEEGESKRARLQRWIDEQVATLPAKERKAGTPREQAEARFRGEVVKRAAYTWLNRLVYLRLLEGIGLRKTKVITGVLSSQGYTDFRELAPALVGHGQSDEGDSDDSQGYALLLSMVFDELALDLPGLFGREGLAELVPMPWSALRMVLEALDDPELTPPDDPQASCWTDNMTLGWVYQYWNDPDREAIDKKLNSGGKVAPHEIASKTQMFTERYMVDWLLQNSLGPMWLAMCKRHGWTPLAQSSGVLDRLEARRVDWRAKREAGEVELTALMPLHDDMERRWAYYVPQPMPEDAPGHAPESIRDVAILDPAVGSGHFLVVAFELLVALYREEAQHRGEQDDPRWSKVAIVERILSHNLHGIDLDPRAVQIAAAALWLEAQRAVPSGGARPERLNLVASQLRLGSLPKDDPGLVELRAELEWEVGISPKVTNEIVAALEGADHLGSLLKVGEALDEALVGATGPKQPEQGSMFGEAFGPEQRTVDFTREEAKERLITRLEEFLAAHTGGADLGLRLRGQQLAAGVRFLRLVQEGKYDLVVGNPPYQGTSKMVDAGYVKKTYPEGKANLYAAFLLRGLQLVTAGGVSALLTMRNWMFIKQYAQLRKKLLEGFDLRALHDLSSGAFEEISAAQVIVSVSSSVFVRIPPSGGSKLATRSYHSATVTTSGETQRKRAATLCHVGRFNFLPSKLRVVPQWPLIYWWSDKEFKLYEKFSPLGASFCARSFQSTSGNSRFLRCPSEVTSSQEIDFCKSTHGSWVPCVNGSNGAEWVEPLTLLAWWGRSGLELKVLKQHLGQGTGQLANQEFFFRRGVSFSMIGDTFSARVHRYPSYIANKGNSVFPTNVDEIVCLLNAGQSRCILQDLNPSIGFESGDVNRLPLFCVGGSSEIIARIEIAFTKHEFHREPSVEFLSPGPSPWIHAQAWAQLAVDRPENTPLPDYIEQLTPEPPKHHLSFALGVALGRFDPAGEAGILDPAKADLSHALPDAILFLDGTLDPDSEIDGLGHGACAVLHETWSVHKDQLDTKHKHLRDYLRQDFFKAVHRQMYENRPIHWPLSSKKRTFVVWINIHRWHAGTLRSLLAEHVHDAQRRLDGELADLRAARDGADVRAARKAEKRLVKVTAWHEELEQFIADLKQCAELGPDGRVDDATYDPDLDDGVMVNSAALWPLLDPQWNKPKQWWKELVAAKGGKDYDWSHLARRYFKDRVEQKCQEDPSLGVAHGCFWKYHPARAHAWELRLQDEIGPDFTIDEDDSDACREAFLRDCASEVAAIKQKELNRRLRKLEKAQKAAQTATSSQDQVSEKVSEDA